MTEEPFVPLNPLETALVDAMEGRIDTLTLLQTLVGSEVAIPSGTEVQPDGTGLSPVVYEKDGVKLMAVCSDVERAKLFGKNAPYHLVMSGRDLLDRYPDNLGMIVNPGCSRGLEILPEGIPGIRQDFCRPQ